MVNFSITFLIINIVISFFLFKNYKIIDIYDHPGDIKKHENSMPILGGILFFINFLIFYILDILYFDFFFHTLNRFSFLFLISSIGIFLMGLYDDKYNLNPLKKFLIMFAMTSLLISSNSNLIITSIDLDLINKIELNNYSFFFTIICVFVFINAYNMLDGVDLNVGLYNFFLLMFFFYKSEYNYLFLVFIIANFFFLIFNFFRRSYFGNNGAYFFSFIIAILSILYFNSSESFNEEDFVLIMLFPVTELIRLFISRIIINKSPFLGDNNHFHHLLVYNFGRIRGVGISQILLCFPIIFDYFFRLNMWLNILIFLIIYLITFYYLKYFFEKNIE